MCAGITFTMELRLDMNIWSIMAINAFPGSVVYVRVFVDIL